MFPVQSLLFLAAGQQALDVDEDCVLYAACATSPSAIVSKDAAQTVAGIQTPTATGLDDNLLIYNGGSGQFQPTKIPLSAGGRIFVSSKSPGTVLLYFERVA